MNQISCLVQVKSNGECAGLSLENLNTCYLPVELFFLSFLYFYHTFNGCGQKCDFFCFQFECFQLVTFYYHIKESKYSLKNILGTLLSGI